MSKGLLPARAGKRGNDLNHLVTVLDTQSRDARIDSTTLRADAYSPISSKNL